MTHASTIVKPAGSYAQRPIIRAVISLAAGFAFRIDTVSPTAVNTRNELLVNLDYQSGDRNCRAG